MAGAASALGVFRVAQPRFQQFVHSGGDPFGDDPDSLLIVLVELPLGAVAARQTVAENLGDD